MTGRNTVSQTALTSGCDQDAFLRQLGAPRP
jgi:hypothetical protein